MQVNDKKYISLSWDKDIEIIKDIRTDVFIKEQNIPEELEWDHDDDGAYHFGIISNETLIAYARVLIKQKIHIGRMAVRKKYRRVGMGSFCYQILLISLMIGIIQKKLCYRPKSRPFLFMKKTYLKLEG